MSNIYPKKGDQLITLENSFIKNTINKSYERVIADTIEAQNSSSGGYHHQQNHNYQQYQIGAKP